MENKEYDASSLKADVEDLYVIWYECHSRWVHYETDVSSSGPVPLYKSPSRFKMDLMILVILTTSYVGAAVVK